MANTILRHVHQVKEIRIRKLEDLKQVADLTRDGWIVISIAPGETRDGEHYLLSLGHE